MKVNPAIQAHYALTVIDTNVFLSAALVPNGAPAQLLDVLMQVGKPVFSQATFSELQTRIWRPKFDRYFSIDRRRSLLTLAHAAAVWVEIPSELAQRRFSRDRDDDAFIHAALAAEATRLITGDDDLLRLNPLGTLHILTPRQALDELCA